MKTYSIVSNFLPSKIVTHRTLTHVQLVEISWNPLSTIDVYVRIAGVAAQHIPEVCIYYMLRDETLWYGARFDRVHPTKLCVPTMHAQLMIERWQIVFPVRSDVEAGQFVTQIALQP